MINKNLLYCFFLTVITVGMMSCNKEETEVSTITNVPLSLSSVDSDITVGESPRVITVNFELDEKQIVPTSIAVRIDPLNTTATNGEDFNFSSVDVEVPAYVREGSFQFEILSDLLAEGDEKVTFLLSGIHEPFGVSNELSFTATIKDSIYNELSLAFDWEGEFEFSGSIFTLCPNVDLDIYVLDADGNDMGIYDAATGACPETMTITPAWEDGDYFLASNLYNNELDSLFLNVPFPLTVTATKGGVFTETFVPEDNWTSEDEDFVHDGVNGFKEVVKITKAGNIYTLTKPDGTFIISGLTNAPKFDVN